jgi:succinyl-diaminopimelate desuccinylase
VPTDTPPGNNAPHAERTAELLQGMGLPPRSTRCPKPRCGRRHGVGHQPGRAAQVRRRPDGGGCSTPMATWCRRARAGPTTPTAARSSTAGHLRPRRGGQQERLLHLHLRRARARGRGQADQAGSVELLFTYDEEFGGEVGPAGCSSTRSSTRPDDRRRLQLPGDHRAQRLPADGGHGARQDGPCGHPDSGVDAMQAAVRS